MTYTVGSLFSGIGGLDLGLERAGMTVVWQSEIDPFACKVLKKHWPEVVNHGDIKQIDWATVEPVDIICGGYPCQPFSTAGKRKGTDDPRHLWPWVRTAISELRPQYAILENVRGHLSMGGLQVVGELAEIGYDAEWRVVSAAGLGAPHRRERIIIVAYPFDQRQQSREKESQSQFGGCSNDETQFGPACTDNTRVQRTEDVAYSGEQQLNGRGHQHSSGKIEKRQALQEQTHRGSGYVANSESSPSRSTKPHHLLPRVWQTTELGEQNCSTRSIGDWWETEPDVGRVADGIPHRVDRLRGLGNAVVPQVAEYIGRLITTL
jgi:DNA (cytosine-5)-methyltransferase 1